ncbi:MAG: DNA/RNA nuclease SfsA [Pseudobdellovibrionaceae bacterium]|nr:DNA/RNA nuclease SfsA [Pseudobdellovibrionaceae bacterium]
MEYRWPTPLKKGIFLKRYQRFLAEIEWEGQTIMAHVPNTGSLLGLLNSGCEALIEQKVSVKKKPSAANKLSWSLKALKSQEGTWVGVDTQVPHHLLKIALTQYPNLIHPHLLDFKTEVPVSSDTRFDGWYRLASGEEGFIEVKNVTLGQMDPTLKIMVAHFPDAPTSRGLKHLKTLMELKSKGYQCQLILMAQRSDVNAFSPSHHIDPQWSAAFYRARHQGIQVKCWSFSVDHHGVTLRNSDIPIK